MNWRKKLFRKHVLSAIAVFLLFVVTGSASAADFDSFAWERVNDGSGTIWSKRAGLQAVELNGDFYVMGGRTPKFPALTFGDSDFHNDVWKSTDRGATWTEIQGDAPWSARAYFQAVTKGDYIYVIGGQDSMAIPFFDFPECDNTPGLPSTDPFIPCPEYVLSSSFFNDIWRSQDGITWEKMSSASDPSKNIYWEGRAGLSAVAANNALYVMAGSENDDFGIIGPTGPPRIYYNDVWKSTDDGATWTEIEGDAPWDNRAGAVALEKDDEIFLIGGEYGFICETDPSGMPTNPDDCPPYFNDVWKSADGVSWTEVTGDAGAGWSKRPGHQCEVLQDEIVCFGGFGLPEFNVPLAILCEPPPFWPEWLPWLPTICPYVYDPFEPANPMDIWSSADGATWTELASDASPPWNAEGPDDIKYDFAAFAVDGSEPAIYTFGGDRETFNPADIPLAPTKVDNDVWRFSGPVEDGCYVIPNQNGAVTFCL